MMADPREYFKPEYLDRTTARLAARLPADKKAELDREVKEIMNNYTPEEGAALVGKVVKDAVMKDCCDWLVEHLEGQPPGTAMAAGDALRMYTALMLGERKKRKAPHLRIIKGGGG